MYLYILELENNFWYVGRSRNCEKRFEEHQKGVGAKWTKLHKPIRIFCSLLELDLNHETRLTIQLMIIYGADKVRGGIYNRLIYTAETLNKLNNSKIIDFDEYSQLNESDTGNCFICSRTDHTTHSCKQKYDIKGNMIFT
jgi:hypothetical protein